MSKTLEEIDRAYSELALQIGHKNYLRHMLSLEIEESLKECVALNNEKTLLVKKQKEEQDAKFVKEALLTAEQEHA